MIYLLRVVRKLFVKYRNQKRVSIFYQHTLLNKRSVPYDFTHILNHYAHKGYRVLACAHRRITIPSTELSKLSREEIECNLDFLGLISMQNKIKNDTKPVIEDLNRNKIKSVMVTGDNPLTAVSVARQCSMIPKSRVFLGSVSEEGIMWKDINSNDTLDPNTLIVRLYIYIYI